MLRLLGESYRLIVTRRDCADITTGMQSEALNAASMTSAAILYRIAETFVETCEMFGGTATTPAITIDVVTATAQVGGNRSLPLLRRPGSLPAGAVFLTL